VPHHIKNILEDAYEVKMCYFEKKKKSRGNFVHPYDGPPPVLVLPVPFLDERAAI
jgi:hypothetical protein